MPNNSTSVSVPVKGMNQDVHPANLSEQGYDFAMNAVVEDTTGNGFPLLQNEASLLHCADFPTGYQVVGICYVVEQDRKILFLTNPTTGFSQIGEVIGRKQCGDSLIDDADTRKCDTCEGEYQPETTPLESRTLAPCCTYTPIATQTCFNFSLDYPVRTAYRIEDCWITVFFTDNYNPPRHVEFEYNGGETTSNLIVRDKFKLITGVFDPVCQEPIYSDQVDCNKLLVDPQLSIPTLDLVDVIGGGSLKAGVYQFLLCMADKNGEKRTPYFHATNPIPIFTNPVMFETDYVTDRSIHINVNNIDLTSPYEYYNIAVAKTINNVTSFELLDTFPVTNKSVVYSGNEKSLTKLDPQDIFAQKLYYSKAKVVATANKYLLFGGLQESTKINIQRIANNVKVQWQTMAVPEHEYRNPRNVNKFRGYMRDEVYTLGLVLVMDNGEETAVGHIPGRAATLDDLTTVTNSDTVKESNCENCGTSTVDVQIAASSLNTASPSSSDSTPTLNENNAVQASSCPVTSYSDTSDTPINDGVHAMPIANAGADQIVNVYAPRALSGVAVANGGATIVSTTWKQISGPNQVTIANAAISNTTFTGFVTGNYTFQFIVIDSNGNKAVNLVNYTVSIPANTAPLADPGADKLITLPTNNSYLDASGSSDSDGISTYAWTQLSGPNTAVIANPASSYTTVGSLIEGTYQFQLVVTDVRGCTSTSTVKIYVLADPSASVPANTNLSYPTNGAIVSSADTVILDWEDVPFATGYNVYYRYPISGPGWTMAGDTTDSHFELDGLDHNEQVDWYVEPKNSVGVAPSASDYYRSFVTPIVANVTSCDKATWQVYNTATVLGTPHQPYKECDETIWEYGDFAYWESTENYPSDSSIWGDLCGQRIRHHKFPDSTVTHIHDGLNSGLDYSKNNYIFPIGIKIDHDSLVTSIQDAVTQGIITFEDSSRIVGYKIVRGNRFQHKSVVAKGLLYDVNQYRRKYKGDYFDNTDVFFGNYPYNDLRSNPFITDDFRNYDVHNTPKGADLSFIFSKRYTFHSPDTHFSEPLMGSKLKLETVEYGMSEGYFTKSKQQTKQRFLSDTAYAVAFSAGVIAALTKLHPQETREYTVKGEVVSGMGVASGVLGPYLPYQVGAGGFTIAESIIDSIVNPLKLGSINSATEAKTQTIQGKPLDYLNPAYLVTKAPYLLPLWPMIAFDTIINALATIIQEAKIVTDMITALTHYRDWCVQYNSIGKYNGYKVIPNSGSKIRSIDSWHYLKPENANISEPDITDPNTYNTIRFNNWNREAGLYLRYTGDLLPSAGDASGIQDNSRFTLDDADVNNKLDKKVYKPISSYYAAVKNYIPDQYGNIYNIEYLATDSFVFPISNPIDKTVYGGDTFINRFGLKKKVPYFLADTFQIGNGIDFNYSDYPNLAVPRHYYNSTNGFASEFGDLKNILKIFSKEGLASFLGRPKSIRDANTESFFYQNGYIYLYHYGIPYFLVESDVNVDFRYAENMQEKGFYPLQSNLDYWLQEENVRLREPEMFLYNNTYSKQNKEHAYTVYARDFIPEKNCLVNHPNRIIYSNGQNWLTFKPNDFYDIPRTEGELNGIDGIENDKVLIRTDDTAQVFNAYITLQTNINDIQVGNGGMFQTKPQAYAETTLGYGGSQHAAILSTEFGHIWVDAKRGQVFNLSPQGFEEISRDGMKNWFKENLPFQLAKDFPTIVDDLDNNFKGMGITLAFDKRFNRLIITKLDYKCLDKTVVYNSNQKQFFKGAEVVKLTDNRYFCDRSWTISYSFYLKSWVSFHSYTPNYYIDGIDYFSCGLNGDQSSMWLHNATNKSYQVFFGKVHPFTIQTISKADINKNTQNAVEFGLDVIRYHNEYDQYFVNNITFNKAVVFNQFQNSGLLNLDYKPKKDLFNLTQYPVIATDNTTIRITNADGIWRFNQFYDLVQQRGNNIPIWLNNCSNTEKHLNNKALDYQMADLDKKRIRGEYVRVRLTNDEHTNYKLIFKWLVNKSTKNYR